MPTEYRKATFFIAATYDGMQIHIEDMQTECKFT